MSSVVDRSSGTGRKTICMVIVHDVFIKLNRLHGRALRLPKARRAILPFWHCSAP